MPFPDSVPILTDDVVRLRPHSENDAERIVEQCTDPESLRWTQVPRGYTLEMAHEWVTDIAKGWDEDGDRLWAIEEVADGEHRFLGSIDLRPRAAGRAEIGYGLHPEGRGRGLMARALKARLPVLVRRRRAAGRLVRRARQHRLVGSGPGRGLRVHHDPPPARRPRRGRPRRRVVRQPRAR